MPGIINLIGQKFGRLTVLYDTGKRKYGHVIWHCKCDCGNECDVRSSNLKTGSTKSCGCLVKENMTKIGKQSKIDLVGQKFGKLTVLYEIKEKENYETIWHCKCDCGNECNILGKSLKSGNTKSCGCLAKELTIKRNQERAKLQMLPKGTKFGKLTIIKLLDERDKHGHTIYQCQCDCGNITNVDRINLVGGHTMSCGCSKISKGEFLIEQLLIQNNIPFEKQKTFENCKFEDTNYFAKFDFYIDNKYIIEFDGIQHFKVTGGWNNEEHLNKLQIHDNFKNEYCFKNNIPIIRIPYTHINNICIEDLILETSNFLIKGDDNNSLRS